MFFTSIDTDGRTGRNAAPRRRLTALFFVTVALTAFASAGMRAQTQANADKTGANANGKSAAPGKKPTPPKPNTTKAANTAPAKTFGMLAPAQLLYQFTPGVTRRFKVTAFFDGHFPPFAQPDNPPSHFRADLTYAVTVKKVDNEGATVEFVVESREFYLFEDEVKEDQKIDLTDKKMAQVSSLTSLEDVQKALNATAVLRPDGSIARILSKSSVKIPFDVGFDIRKMFLMLLPVTFPKQPLKPGDAWPATDGLLGSKQGKTTYENHLAEETVGSNGALYKLTQKAASTVEDKLDKAENSTGNEADVYRTLSGKVDLTTEMTFTAPIAPPNAAAGKPLAGEVKSAHLLMNATINKKRVKINPDRPEVPENEPMDVRARMTVTRDDAPVKSAEKAGLPDKPKIAEKTGPKSDKSTGKPNGKPGVSGDKAASGAK